MASFPHYLQATIYPKIPLSHHFKPTHSAAGHKARNTLQLDICRSRGDDALPLQWQTGLDRSRKSHFWWGGGRRGTLTRLNFLLVGNEFWSHGLISLLSIQTSPLFFGRALLRKDVIPNENKGHFSMNQKGIVQWFVALLIVTWLQVHALPLIPFLALGESLRYIYPAVRYYNSSRGRYIYASFHPATLGSKSLWRCGCTDFKVGYTSVLRSLRTVFWLVFCTEFHATVFLLLSLHRLARQNLGLCTYQNYNLTSAAL